MTIAAISSLFVIGVAMMLLGTWKEAFKRGVRWGRDTEWERQRCERIEAEKMRRGTDGRFKKHTL